MTQYKTNKVSKNNINKLNLVTMKNVIINCQNKINENIINKINHFPLPHHKLFINIHLIYIINNYFY